MSLELARQIDREYPNLLQMNVGLTCHQFTLFLIAALRAQGRVASLMGKTLGEGQYVPDHFQRRTVAGLDGKPCVITGVSHDAIWVDGKQVDTIAGANDEDQPIFNADGAQIRGVPVWNEIPPQYWRAHNPPLNDFVTPEPPSQPLPPQAPVYPGDHVFDEIGAKLFADYAQAGNAPDPQMGRWFGRTIFDWLAKHEPSLDASITKHRKEWRALLGLPLLAFSIGCAGPIDRVMSEAAKRPFWESTYQPTEGNSMAAAYADLLLRLQKGGVTVELVAELPQFGLASPHHRAIALKADLPVNARFEVLAHEAGHLLSSPAFDAATNQVFAELVGVEIQAFYGSRTAERTASAYLPIFKAAFINVATVKADIHRAVRIILGFEPWPKREEAEQ